jgi:predicted alpha/beta hydrolase
LAAEEDEDMTDVAGVARSAVSMDGTRVGFMEYGSLALRRGEPSVFFVPALGAPVGYYSDMLTRWAQDGRHIVAVELRGMPLTPMTDIRRQQFGYSTLINNDFPAITSIAFSDSGRFIVVGHSLGGQLALLATASKSIKPLSVVAIASGTSSPAARGTGLGRARRRGQVAFVRATSSLHGHWPGERLGFGGRQPRSLMRDWCYEGSHGRYKLHGDDMDYEIALTTITVPILMLSLIGDPIIPERAVDHLRHRLPKHSEHRRLTSSSVDGFDHMRWARREARPILDAIESWAY